MPNARFYNEISALLNYGDELPDTKQARDKWLNESNKSSLIASRSRFGLGRNYRKRAGTILNTIFPEDGELYSSKISDYDLKKLDFLSLKKQLLVLCIGFSRLSSINYLTDLSHLISQIVTLTKRIKDKKLLEIVRKKIIERATNLEGFAEIVRRGVNKSTPAQSVRDALATYDQAQIPSRQPNIYS